MKKILLALMCVCTFTSCAFNDIFKYSKDINDGTIADFDEYPGMNVNESPLTGIPFAAPANFEINNVIMGLQNQSSEEDQNEDLKVTKDMFGSGLFVIVTLDITNLSSSKQTLTLPCGLLLQSASSSYQNGILVKDVLIPFKANERRHVSVRFYCLNAAAHGSDSEAIFGLGYVTNIPAFEPLFTVCAEKKLNISEYNSSNILSYYSACTLVQEIVWAITKGKIFEESDIRKYLKHVKKTTE
ncbi:MAG: hypothetical protein J6T80_06300 [Paludibacteraceae bacterium]|nr:hypothetical protein [Paludibacteraceae bacterium]